MNHYSISQSNPLARLRKVAAAHENSDPHVPPGDLAGHRPYLLKFALLGATIAYLLAGLLMRLRARRA